MKFTKIGLEENIVKALTGIGFETATEVQEKTIPLVLKGADVTVRSQTGSGKTFAYILPLLQTINYEDTNVQVLVICPTRELSLQVKEEVEKLKTTLNRLKVVPIYGGSDIGRQINALKRKPQVVVGTPGRLIDHLTRRTLKLHGVKTVVLDEADEMLNMGFKEDMEKILKQTPSQRQTLMFSATYPKDILSIIDNYQTNPIKIEVGEDNKSLDNIKQYYLNINKSQKKEGFLELFKKLSPKRSIIFTNTKLMAQDLSDFLNRNGYLSQSLHGDLRQSTRKKVINEIKTNKVNILVASDVAARGIDINDVDYVINYDLPHNVEYFLHRIGRTARAGKSGNAVTIITTKAQLSILKDFANQTNSTFSELQLSSEYLSGFDKSKKSSSRKKSYGKEKGLDKKNFARDKYSSKDRFSGKDSSSSSKRSSYGKEERSGKRNFSDDKYSDKKDGFRGKGASLKTGNRDFSKKTNLSEKNNKLGFKGDNKRFNSKTNGTRDKSKFNENKSGGRRVYGSLNQEKRNAFGTVVHDDNSKYEKNKRGRKPFSESKRSYEKGNRKFDELNSKNYNDNDNKFSNSKSKGFRARNKARAKGRDYENNYSENRKFSSANKTDRFKKSNNKNSKTIQKRKLNTRKSSRK